MSGLHLTQDPNKPAAEKIVLRHLKKIDNGLNTGSHPGIIINCLRCDNGIMGRKHPYFGEIPEKIYKSKMSGIYLNPSEAKKGGKIS